MNLVSLHCLAFAVITVLLYFVIPGKVRWVVLLAANIYFYLSYGPVYIIFIILCGLISYLSAIVLEKKIAQSAQKLKEASAEEKDAIRRAGLKQKKSICTLTVLLILAPWIVIKYGGFIMQNVLAVLSLFKINAENTLTGLILPLGMSFYVFHAIGYVVDVYRAKYPAEKNFFKYFTFVSFFPHITEGPFSRFNELGKEIFSEHHFSYERLCEGCARILWGAYKKVAIADILAGYINNTLGNYEDYGFILICFAVVMYSFRIYADFSGYMDMMCGFCHILGIELSENFKQPFMAKTVDEYWRRWHITLGRWFRDYVFYPVSMSKTGSKLSKWARGKWGAKTGKLIAGHLALFFVWTATGLWHGANWTFLVWGYLNFIVILSTTQLEETYKGIKTKLHINSDSFLWKAFCVGRTFVLISIFRFFSLSPDMGTALSTIAHAFTNFRIKEVNHVIFFFRNISGENVILWDIGIIALIIVDVLCEKGKWEEAKKKCPAAVRAVLYALMLLTLIILAPGEDVASSFMYANF